MRAFDRFKLATGSEILLLVVGRRGWLTRPVEECLSTLVSASDVHFTGYLADSDLARVLASAHALCYVSLWEGFGLPIVEAMACGVPVLTSHRSSMLEIAAQKAVTVDPEDTAAIAEGMRRLGQDADLWSHLSTVGLEHSRKFSWERMTETVAKTLFG